MIATGIPIPIASRAASRKVRSRSSWPTADGPTPRPGGAADPGVSIGTSLLGFGDFGAQTIEKRPVRAERRMRRHQRVHNLVGLEQQVVAFVRGGGVREAPEVAF